MSGVAGNGAYDITEAASGPGAAAGEIAGSGPRHPPGRWAWPSWR
ncbi:hypothetical protein O1L68_32570 [Streptomyces lydicus]|nr:hypothetical protein [Streptomyces lydicus]